MVAGLTLASNYSSARRFIADDPADGERTWIIQGNDSVRNAVIVMSYFFVCSFAITMGPVLQHPKQAFPS